MATIIIVDDEEELRENLQDLLEFKGYDVSAYSSGEELLDKFEEENADLILLNYQLPGLDGIELIPHIRNKRHNIPIGLVTASS